MTSAWATPAKRRSSPGLSWIGADRTAVKHEASGACPGVGRYDQLYGRFGTEVGEDRKIGRVDALQSPLRHLYTQGSSPHSTARFVSPCSLLLPCPQINKKRRRPLLSVFIVPPSARGACLHFFLRQGFSRPLPSSAIESNFVYSRPGTKREEEKIRRKSNT